MNYKEEINFKAYETSSAQKRLFMVNRLLGDTTLYNEFRVWTIKGNLDPALLEIAVNQLSQRHEALRTCFTTQEGEILQKVYDHIEIDFKYTHMNVTDTDELIEDFLIPYDLEKAPLWKIELVQSGRERQLLLFDFHHLIADGTSMDVIMKELTDLYQGKPLPEPEAQYVDFTIWQNDYFASDTIKKQEAYWLEVFEGELPLLDLPVDSPRSLAADIEGNTFEFEMDEGLTKRVNRLASQHGTTLYVVLSAVLNILLSKYSSQEDIVMGTPISGRTHREFRNMVGMFVNTLAMRNKPAAEKTFKEFTAEVSRSTFAAFENQDYQFEMLVEKLVPQRQLNRNPLFDVMFALQNYSRNINIPGMGNDELVFIPYGCKSKVSKFDLSLQAFEIDRHILFSLDYRTSLFRKDTIERLSEHFINIFHKVTRNCNIRLSDIRLLSKAEQDRLLYVLNGTAVDYPADKLIHELFELEAEKNPDGTAIVGNAAGGLAPLNVTYKKLNKKSDGLAYQLKEKGVQPGTSVGLMVERSVEMIIGMLGILKAGGAYLPIDPGYPRERIDYILKDSGAEILLATLHPSPLTLHPSPPTMRLAPCALRLAYVIYTSGTTGKPKGIMIEHRNVVRLVKSSNVIHFTPADRLLLTGKIVFDITTFEIWGPLLNGSALFLIHRDVIMDGEKLGEILCKYGISILHLIPQLFNQLAEQHAGIFAELTYLLVGGDIVRPHYINKLRKMHKNLNILHMYGPSENTTFSTFFPVEKEYEITIPIGKPINNSTVYITDRHGNLKPFGAVGELCVGGPGVARGYLNNPELTVEKFCRRRHIIYRTGDLGRWLPDGNIEFMGRIDSQVKIRGIRIELAEIESQLLKHELISEAAVIDRQEDNGEKYLCAYIVAKETFDQSELNDYLSKSVPGYMMPAFYVNIDNIPVTANGKVDRNALPAPGITAGEKYEAPGNEIEETLAAIWSEVLNIDKEVISIDGNFFELGGHSLKAAVVISKIHKELDVKLELAELFSTPFIRGLAERIKGTAKERYAAVEAVEKKDYYVLSPAQKRLYILQQLDPESTAYNMPLPIPLPAEPDTERLQRTFNRLIERHESLRTSFFPVNEEPVQGIHDKVEFKIENYLARSFDLSRPPLLRAGVIKTAGGNTFLLVDMHHIAADGTSLNILEKEFMSLYSLEGEDLPFLRLQYKDYAQWQNSLLQQELMKEQESYWTGLFSGQLPVLNLSTDYPRPLIQSFEGAAVDFVLNEQETQRLKDIAKKTDATLYMVVLSVYTILLSKLSGQEDIIVGTPVAARRHADLEHIIGMFVNTLALRNYPESKKAFKEFLIQLRNSTLEAFENQEYPFENLVDQVSPRRDTSRNPIFDAMFNLWDQPDYRDRSQEKNRYGLINNTAKFDLNLSAIVIGDGEKILFNLEYGTRLFKAATIERIIGYFKNIVSLLPEDISKPWALKLSEIEIMTEEEKKKILEISRGPQEEWDEEETIHHWFEKQVEQTPDNIAAVGRAHSVRGPRALTYRELNRKSNQLAYLLKEKGVQANSIVGLMVGRSLEMLISILAIMKAGGAYLPVDEEYPWERKKYMLEDSEVKLLLTNHDIESQTGYISKDIEVIDPGNETIYRGSDINPGQVNGKKGSNLVYLIYTSGSTGNPKGVMLEHRNLVNLIRFQYKSTNLDCSRILQFATISFDASFHEIFSALLCGGSLYLVDKETRADIPLLFTLIGKNQIRTLFLPMSLLQIIFSDDDYIHFIPGCIKHIQTAGEQVIVSNRFRDYLVRNNIYLHNHYGPSEAHVVTTLTMDPRESIPARPSIGKPILNTTIYILDKGKHLLPVGVPGELYIGGIQVGRGYLGREKLTAEKFIMYRPVDGAAPQRLYRTGDLSRWLSGGNIEFLGRIDHQVKLRGFRVELGEIESRLLNHDEIKEAVVLARTDGDDRAAGPGSSGDKYLCAYIAADKELSVPQLSEYLSGLLPDYMIPSYFVFMEKIPLTPNGKIDRRALPAPRLKAGEGYIAPGNEIEKKLVEIWSGVLGIADDVIGIDGNFFQLGGHSLKATVMVARVHKALNVTLPLAEVFKTPTIRGLAKYITGTVKDKYTAVQPVEKRDYYSLSSAQKRLYILQQMDLESTAYNLPRVIPLPAEPDMKRLEKTFIQLIRRHESLRTSFHLVAEEPVQRVHDNARRAIKNFDQTFIKVWPPAGPPEATFIRSFDLSQAPLLRVGIIKTGNSRNILLVDMHHIISDGVSQQILVKEFNAFYSGAELAPLKLQYSDYALWQSHKSKKQPGVFGIQEKYWLEEFAGEIPVLSLPLDYPRPAVQSFEGGAARFALSASETGDLNALAAQEGVTPYMLLLALLDVLLSKLSGGEDIVIGTAVAGRGHTDLQGIIGMFVNTLALRNQPKGEMSFREFLKEVKGKALKAFENQEYPFEDLVEKVQPVKDAGRNPLFDVMFTLQTQVDDKGGPRDKDENEAAAEKRQSTGFEHSVAKFDLTLTGLETGGRLRLYWEYCTRLFKKETIKKFTAYFKGIIASVLENPVKKIADIAIISEDEKQRVLVEFNDTKTVYPKDKTIHELFAGQVEKAAGHTALIDMDRHLTYGRLNEESNRLAGLLKERGITTDVIVAIKIDRSIEMIVGIMGILKAGGAYLPIDPSYPGERIDYMLKDSGAGILLKGSDFTPEALKNCPQGASSHLPLAYVIYTSGTTGKPKGTLTCHYNVVRVVKNTNYINITPRDRVLQLSNYAFDGSVFDIYGALLNGAPLVMIKKENVLAVDILSDVIIRENIAVFFITTALFNALVDLKIDCFKGIRKVLFGGENVSLDHSRRALAYLGKDRIIHVYGPTETTVFTSYYFLNEISENAVTIPIGKPISNTGIYILDNYMKPVPIGVTGEVYIGGDGLARGYLNRPELTGQNFLTAKTREGTRRIHMSYMSHMSYLYKTGDLAKQLPGGNIEFLSRIDSQVKIRGFRIELGEIENCLLNHIEIKESVVLVVEDTNDLCAYIVASPDRELSIPGLREYLAKLLPGYMIPAYFVRIEKIPLTANGKVDRKSLPLPAVRSGEDRAAPANEIEEKLAAVWSEVLHIPKEKISVNADFFELGGHSLRATIVIAKIHKELDINIPLAELFRTPTIRGLFAYIAGRRGERYASINPVEKKDYYALSSAQKRLYILQQMEPGNISYNMPQVIPLTSTKEIGKRRLESAFKKLIARHESLGTSFHMIENQPVQRIHEEAEFDFDLAVKNAKDREGLHHSSFIIHPFVCPFDLSKAPLLRVGLIDTTGNEYILMIDMHHIITDGTSQAVLTEEFLSLYTHGDEELPPLRLQYKDYSHWQNSEEQQAAVKNQGSYWLRLFSSSAEFPVLNLPTDYPRPLVQSFEGCAVEFILTGKETRTLKELAKQANATLYMAILAVFNILLAKLGGREDIVIGTPVAGRRHADLQRIIGMFVNTLALRNYPSGEKTFTGFLKEVKERTLEAFENQEYQFEDLVDKLSIPRDTGRNPLFDVMFNLLNQAEYNRDTRETKEKQSVEHRPAISKFDLTLTAVDMGEHLVFAFEYCRKLFEPNTIERIISYFKKILYVLPGNPDRKIAGIEIITEDEKQRILYKFNDTASRYPKDKTIHELFEEQADKAPDNAAVIGKASSPVPMAEAVVTYKVLNEESNRLAHHLRKMAVIPDTIVGIMIARSIEMIIGILGILKAGGAYLPIDPGYPEERKQYMLADSGARILLKGHGFEFPASPLPRPLASQPSGLAYVIYTSGTTGRPKGVLLEHRSVVNTLVCRKAAYKMAGGDISLQLFSYAFDGFVTSFFTPVISGAAVVLLSEEEIKDIAKIRNTIVKNKVTHFISVPPLYQGIIGTLTKEEAATLEVVTLAGDKLPPWVLEATKQKNPGMEIANEYGVTEMAIMSTMYRHQEREGRITIGKPVWNTRIYILAKGLPDHKQLQPLGVPGEICISGIGTARGYLNNPELTNDKFLIINNKLEMENGAGNSIYRSGDLGRWLPDGNIELLGRMDHQVKIRGYRIELEEIENRLLKHQHVKEVVVVLGAGPFGSGNKYLCAYFVTGSKTWGAGHEEELREYLSQTLPDYMIPSYFILLDRIPLTPNGKINRKALPEPEITIGKKYIAPGNELEEKLASIWSEVLAIEKDTISMDANFFQLGGHSLKATVVIYKISKEFNLELPLIEVLKNPTIKSIASLIETLQWVDDGGLNKSGNNRESEEILL